MTKKKLIVYTVKLTINKEEEGYKFDTEVKGQKKMNICELMGLIEIYKYSLMDRIKTS